MKHGIIESAAPKHYTGRSEREGRYEHVIQNGWRAHILKLCAKYAREAGDKRTPYKVETHGNQRFVFGLIKEVGVKRCKYMPLWGVTLSKA